MPAYAVPGGQYKAVQGEDSGQAPVCCTMALHSMPSIQRLRLRQRQQPAGERAAQRTPLAAAVGLVNGDPVQPPRLVNLLKLQAGQAVGEGRWQAAASQGSAISLTGSTAWAGASCKADQQPQLLVCASLIAQRCPAPILPA